MYPRRIVCLTEETTETLYLLGEQERIVGISGFTVRPPQARRDKPKVSAFTRANIERILGLEPDLVLGFSDLQADIAAQLIRAGVEVHVFNQRTVQGILDMVITLGSLVGARDRAERLAADLRAGLAEIQRKASGLPRRPRVYFEEWDDPLIGGIGWVGELVELAGGEECFPELRGKGLARDRIVDPEEVVHRRPEVIVASWCGKRFRPERVRARPGWDVVPAVRDGELHELPASEILSPGPAALTDGVRGLHRIVRAWAARHA